MTSILGIAGSLRKASYNRAALFPLNRPEVMIGNAADRFDGSGNLVDEETGKRIRQLLESLVSWTRQLAKGR